MESIERIFRSIKDFLSVPIFTLGETQLTLWTFLYLLVFLLLLIYISGKLKNWVSGRLLARSSLQVGMRIAIGSMLRYLVVVIGLLVLLQTAGIDLTTLNVLAGAIGIGVGFGLQTIANNFISGLIILFEGPVKIGDRIEIGDVEGDVARVGTLSTSVVTNDNITIIIPNARLISDNIINWSHNDEVVRFKIPLSVAYGSDIKLVEKLLLEVAAEDDDILDDPPPFVILREFGDSGLHFELRVWSGTLTHRKGRLISKINVAVYERFQKNGIEIPFPQRDIHIRTNTPGDKPDSLPE
ncbi:MAG: mechanosensitive ion channel domain-containing protein [Bacteroidota bacterium]